MPRLQFYVDEPLCERLNSIARNHDISVSQLIVEVLTNIDIEASLSAPDSFSNQMAEILKDIADYVELCKKDDLKPRLFALREAVSDFHIKYPTYIEREGQKIRNSAGGRVGRQFYYLVNKGLVPNVKTTGLFDRMRTVLYEVVLPKELDDL